MTERHNHSIPVSYVDKGKDATVCWNSQDFKFKNSTEYPIYIIAELSSDKRVHVDVYGLLLPDGMTIKVEAELTETVDFEIEKEPSPFLAKGEKVILKEGRTGYKAQAYKLYYDRDGNLIDRKLLCKSVYPAQNRVVQYGE